MIKDFNKSIQGKLFNYFQGRLRLKKSTNGWWRTDCIECGGHHSMGINVETYKVHCFKCQMEMNPVRALMVMEGFETLPQAWQFLKIQQEYEYYESTTGMKKDYNQIELPESYKLITTGNGYWGTAARHYLSKRRGFKLEDLALKGVGYCTEGEYAGYIIFPFYRKGKLIYFQGRLFTGFGPKMKNPPEEQYGIGKSQLIYNVDAFYIYNKAYLVESITNALTLGDMAGASLGKAVSPYQLSNILMSPCEKLVIILDPDAMMEALEVGMQVVHHKKTKVVQLPDKIEVKGELKDADVNELGRQKTMSFIKQTAWEKYMQLFKRKLNINEGPQPAYQRVGPYKGIRDSR